MVNLELDNVFYTVAKCKSITKAAEELFISQPAVSHAIKQLESELGGKLFNRVSRGMELTETGGKQMFEAVERAMAILAE
ncbi:MAG: LysR family transcriptional regulator, partial [Clostridia bacterium]|nr:LysR family transcriptional regulator [Clostridia bacterium]